MSKVRGDNVFRETGNSREHPWHVGVSNPNDCIYHAYLCVPGEDTPLY